MLKSIGEKVENTDEKIGEFRQRYQYYKKRSHGVARNNKKKPDTNENFI